MRLRDFIPALRAGAKIFPQEIASALGLPYVADMIYVDPTNGSNSNGGKRPNDALLTISEAHDRIQSNHHDVVALIPGGVGSGTGVSQSAAVTWSKNLAHLVGVCAPVKYSQRARILGTTAATSPQFTFSSQGSIIANVQLGVFVDTNVNVLVSGQRNYFSNVHFAGIGDSTAGDDTAARALSIQAGSENVFEGCVVGLDTISRSVANAELDLGTAATRNSFYNCEFPTYADNAGHFFVIVGASGGVDRTTLYDRCRFVNAAGSAATTMTDAFNMGASSGGIQLLQDCLKVGCTGWADTLTDVYLLSVSSNSTYNQGIGFPVNAAA